MERARSFAPFAKVREAILDVRTQSDSTAHPGSIIAWRPQSYAIEFAVELLALDEIRATLLVVGRDRSLKYRSGVSADRRKYPENRIICHSTPNP